MIEWRHMMERGTAMLNRSVLWSVLALVVSVALVAWPAEGPARAA